MPWPKRRYRPTPWRARCRSQGAQRRCRWCIERLTQILKAFDRARFGRRSEKLGSPTTDDEQPAFVFEEIETGIAAIRAQVNKGRERPEGKPPPLPRKGFAQHLERVEVVIEPEELPEHAGKQKVLIGEDVSERLDVMPAKFRVIVTCRPKYALKNEDGVIQAPAPAHIIEGGIPTEALLGRSPSPPASASPGISRATAASCRSTTMPPTTNWSAPIVAMTASHWLAAGHTAGESSMSCMSRKA